MLSQKETLSYSPCCFLRLAYFVSWPGDKRVDPPVIGCFVSGTRILIKVGRSLSSRQMQPTFYYTALYTTASCMPSMEYHSLLYLPARQIRVCVGANRNNAYYARHEGEWEKTRSQCRLLTFSAIRRHCTKSLGSFHMLPFFLLLSSFAAFGPQKQFGCSNDIGCILRVLLYDCLIA